MPCKHPNKVKQPLHKPLPMCKSIMDNLGVNHTPCIINLMKHPNTWCEVVNAFKATPEKLTCHPSNLAPKLKEAYVVLCSTQPQGMWLEPISQK